ncbi:sickle tail protein homolog isoform X3 [Rhinatrema bivittatum]|uniref:sickle tail protein homolog isoform X3 n=1 Tax=Rhinatrema bivittatum TaxID=194408 RepID=UPI00112C1239|nr:sickle tail protein homolog isoform X3 [Rhinatrema bivittatum]
MEENGLQKSELECLASSESRHMKDQGKKNTHITSFEDAECHRAKEHLANGSNHHPNPKSTRSIPRRHTVGGPRSSKEILGMQTSEMDKKREAFLEHLKQKYPHHANAIMGHQERLRDQAVQCMLTSLHSELDIQRYLMKIESSHRTRSPKPPASPQPSLGDQAEHLSGASADSLEAMSEGDSPTPFSRGSRTRASLPVVRSANQTKERSLGVLYLQYGDETKQLRMPNEITSTDTIRALFVSAFPQQLTMKMLESPSVAIYIKDESRNIYYELNDVRNIQDRSLLKVYNKDPAHVFNHTPRTVNGDVRMQRENSYTGREGPITITHRPGSATHPSHGGPNSPPPTPVPHSMPASPSRIPYGGPRPMGVPGNATIPRDRLSSVPPSRSISPSPSAILERRDVKPDEDMSNKNLALLRNEGLYADPYLYHEGRMSVASSHTGHPLDIPDHILAYHRGAVRSASAYSNPSVQAEMMEQSMYRQKPRKYTDSHLPTLGSKTPPSSPHRVTDIRMIDLHSHNTHVPPHAIQPDRSSPVRQSFKKEPGASVFVDTTISKVRNVSGLPGMADMGPPLADKQTLGVYGTSGAPKDAYTRERMQAMEKQIASLTGLVQSALFKGPNPSNTKDASSEKMIKPASNVIISSESGGIVHMPGGKNSLNAVESTTVLSHLPPPVGATTMQVSLHELKHNVSDLRLQLHKMRQLQLQNQELLRAMVKKAELEINSKVIEGMKRMEDPVQRQRVLVEQERQRYLHEEERIVKKLCDLEGFVEELKKNSTAFNRVVTLKDVEDGAFLLRQIGESVASLKGEFPPLQNKMRAVLRVEVEAVKFLKEEPHKLDCLLKRIRSMTDVLTTLRRQVTEGLLKDSSSTHTVHYSTTERATEALYNQNEVALGQGHSQHGAESQTSSVKSEVVPFPTMTVHHAQSSPVVIHQSQHSSALVNNPPQSPSLASHSVGVLMGGHQTSNSAATSQETAVLSQPMQSPQSPTAAVNGSTMQSLFIEEIHHVGYRNRAVSIEEAEKKWEEKRQNLDQYNGKEFEKLLEEAQANIMKSIPSLEVPPQPSKRDVVDRLEVVEETSAAEQDNNKVGKSPPPPPPRRIYPPGSGPTPPRTGDVIYALKKENSKESNEEAGLVLQTKVTRSQTEDQALPPKSPPVAASAVKDEDEEGERIMAELQAFQKCSFVDANSKTDVEQSRADTHDKDIRPGPLVHPKEKKKLEFFYEDTEKSDDGYRNNVTAEHKRVVYCVTMGSSREQRTKPIESPQDDGKEKSDVSDASTISAREDHCSENGNSAFSMRLENEEYPKNMAENKESFTSSSEECMKSKDSHVGFRVHYPVGETETQNISFVMSEGGEQRIPHNELENQEKLIPASSVASDDKESEDSKICDLLLASKLLRERELPFLDIDQQVVLRPKASRNVNVNYMELTDSACSSPSEENSPTDNIAFMITKTKVQVLSSGEVHDIVKRKGDDVQTVNIDGRSDVVAQQDALESAGTEDPVVCMDKKPVIIIFDEPMDIRSAYKRLSTIFEECEEELERMMTESKIVEEEEEEEEAQGSTTHTSEMHNEDDISNYSSDLRSDKQHSFKCQSFSNPMEIKIPDEETSKTNFTFEEKINSEVKSDSTDYHFGSRQDTKKKFKFKFPKKQLAALTQAIRTGTKTGKKTLQVVVYEEEEESDGTVKQHKEAKRFEIARSKPQEDLTKITSEKQQEQHSSENVTQVSRTDEIRKNTYRTLDSLEQTIKQLENTISEMSPKATPETVATTEVDNVSYSSFVTQPSAKELTTVDETKAFLDTSSSIPSIPRKGSSGSSQTSRMPIPVASKSRQQGSMDKPGKQAKLQDSQRQYRQANGGTKKPGGDCKVTSPNLPTSKIPAFSPTSGKSSSLPAYSGDSSNPHSPPPKSPVSSNLLSPQTGRSINSSSLIPSVPNGSLKLQNPTHTGKGHHLSFSLQTSNGRSSSSSSSSPSSPSPTSPTSLNQGMKSIRTIHTPSFTSYKAQNGNASKSTTATAKETS